MKKKKKDERIASKLFSARVGMCSISMMLDVRHSKDKNDHPLSLCFSINRKRVYHSLGERYTHEELARILNATGQGERKGECETNFEKKVRKLCADMVHITNLFKQGKYKTMMAEVADLARRLKEIVYGVKG